VIGWTHGDVERLVATVLAADALMRLHPGEREFTEPLRRAVRALYSPWWEATVDALRAGDPGAVEPVVIFLEVDPQCFRSGYEKERLCPLLARAALTGDQRRRVLDVASRVLADPERPLRERTRYQRMAVQLAASG
jgi:hypothetical protein